MSTMHIQTNSPSAAGPSAAAAMTTTPSSAAIPASPQVPTKPRRMDTQDLKSKLATALGSNGKRYWSTLLAFMTAKIDRAEFEEEAMMCLKPQHVHLHNSLVLGLLYNASADVPGPSARSGLGMRHDRNVHGQLVDVDGNVITRYADADEEAEEGELQLLQPAKKRLRLLTAGLSRKERARIRNIPKHLSNARAVGAGAASSGWAGAGADMLEKKRKEEEKRRSVEEKQRVREAYSEVGARDWRLAALNDQAQVAGAHNNLSMSTQAEIARALAAPLCVESKQLPDLESMRDLMTLQSVEAGLTQSAQVQAAAMLLAALQCHLQNVMASIITKIRANRQMGIRVTGIERSRVASDSEGFTLVTEDHDQSFHDADESLDSSSMELTQSPSTSNRHLRAVMLHDTSSISSSTASLGIMSGADSSMISLASTAPTSLPPGSVASSEQASNGDGAGSHAGPVKGGRGNGDHGDGDYDESGDTSMSSSEITPLTNNDGSTGKVDAKGGPSTLELRHLSFLLNVAPQTVVEALGQGSHERLLAADWTNADEQAQRELESTADGIIQRQARLTSTAKLSTVRPNALGAQYNPATAARNKFIVDQLAPIRLFDRRSLVESQASTSSTAKASHPKKGGLSLPSSTSTARPTEASSSSATQNGQSTEAGNEDDATVAESTSASAGAGAEERQRVDLSEVIASRYGNHAQAASAATTTAKGPNAASAFVPNGAMPSHVNPAAMSAAAANAHHHRGQDSQLYDVVDPVALLAGLVN